MEVVDNQSEALVTPQVPLLYTPEVAEMFDKAKAYLDAKRDKDEELTRLSKDITWESKRIIYVLHKHFVNDNALDDARKRIKSLLSHEKYFFGLAKALEGEDLSLHHRRYTCCTQEYIEAVVFLRFLETRKIPTYEEIRDSLIWEVPDKSQAQGQTSSPSMDMDRNVDSKDVAESNRTKTLMVPLSTTDYVLGVCDFTGELMKAAVPTLTKPKWHSFLCQSFALIREIYAEFLGIYDPPREFLKKLSVMKASVIKIETTVYKLKMKFLIYGRMPDAVELQMIEQAADTFTENPRGRVDNGNDNGSRGNKRNNTEEYPNDSGVE